MTMNARQELADASRILARHDIFDAFGHISRRDPAQPDHFLISRSLAPAQVTADDIVELGLDGTPIKDGCPPVFVERFIHSEIYRVRPDVHAIVHSHAVSVIPFTLVPDVAVLPACHMCGFLHQSPGPFEIAEHGGDGTDLLISDRALGAALANHLGLATMVMMRGHGFTVVGNSVPHVTYRAIYTSINCIIQAQALRLGQPRFLSAAEAWACDQRVDKQFRRAWELWCNQLDREDGRC